jgi:hypothetical protein
MGAGAHRQIPKDIQICHPTLPRFFKNCLHRTKLMFLRQIAKSQYLCTP